MCRIRVKIARMVPTNKEVFFCVNFGYAGKADLSKSYKIQNENWG